MTIRDIQHALEEKDGYNDVCDLRIMDEGGSSVCSSCEVALHKALSFCQVFAYGKMHRRRVCLDRPTCRKRVKKLKPAKAKARKDSIRELEKSVIL